MIADSNLRLAVVAAAADQKLIPKLELKKLAKKHPPDLDDDEDDADYVFNGNLAAAIEAIPVPAKKLGEVRKLHWPRDDVQFAIWPQFDGESDEFHVADLAGIDACAALEELCLEYVRPIGNVAAIGKLVRLRKLTLGYDAQVGKLDFLAPLVELRALDLHGPITNLKPLMKLPRLERLHLEGVRVTDVTPIAALPALKKVSIRWLYGEPGPSKEAARALVDALAGRAIELDIAFPSGEIKPARKAKKSARNPELEKRLHDNPEDDAAYLVYGDWLQAQGDPHGELIALDAQLERKKSKKLEEQRRACFLAIEDSLLGGAKVESVSEWKLGFLRKVRLAYVDDAKAVLRAPAARFLAELDLHELDGGKLTNVLLKVEPPPPLRALEILQDVNDVTGDLGEVWKRFPGLRRVTIKNKLDLGRIALPEVRSVHLSSIDCEKQAKSIRDARWPKLEELSISRMYGEEDLHAALDGILDGGVPTLRRLSIGTYAPDGAVAVLAGARVLPQLTHLSIDYWEGIGPAGVKAILSAKNKFAHLEVFDFTVGKKVGAAEKKALATVRKPAPKKKD